MSDIEYKIIGVTQASRIIKPSFPCDGQIFSLDVNSVNNLNNRITKIAPKNLLEDELREYASLPDVPDAAYIKPSDLILCKLNQSEKSKYMDILNKLNVKYTPIFEQDIIDNDFNYDETWQLQMPYLGKDFLNYLTGFFKSPYVDLFSIGIKGDHVMSVLEFKNLYDLLVTSNNGIYKTIEMLNALDIYHNDIKANNILYNLQTNKIYLIDFGITKGKQSNKSEYLHFSTKLDYKYTDIVNFCKLVLVYFLYVAIGNKYIYDNIIELIYELEELIQIKFLLNLTNMPLPQEKPPRLVNLKDEFIDPFLDKLTRVINGLDNDAPNTFVLSAGETPFKTPFKNYKLSAAAQRKKALISSNARGESMNMSKSDKEGLRGGKKRKTMKRKRKITKRKRKITKRKRKITKRKIIKK